MPGGWVLSDNRAWAAAGWWRDVVSERTGEATGGAESAIWWRVAPFAGPAGRSAAHIPLPTSAIAARPDNTSARRRLR